MVPNRRPRPVEREPSLADEDLQHVPATWVFDMDLYSSVEIADGARRTVSALRKFQLTMAVGDPDAAEPPKHLDIPPLLVDMDGGYGNAFNAARTHAAQTVQMPS